MYPEDIPVEAIYKQYPDLAEEDYLSNYQKDRKAREIAENFNVKVTNRSEDYFLHVDKSNCPRYSLAE